MRIFAIGLTLASMLLGQGAPLVIYENPEAERLDVLRKQALPSRRAAFGRPHEHRLGALNEKEKAMLAKPSLRQRTGVHRLLDLDLATAGQWDGAGVWRMAVASEGAQSLRLHITGFHAGSGRLWVHDGVGESAQVFGPWTADGPWGDGDFWTDTVVGERLVLEYEPGNGGQALPFQISALAHGAQLLNEKAQAGASAAASCNLDVSCYPEWANTAKAVGRYTFESDGSTYLCSGTLLNVPNTLATPYFLTADHCISAQQEARTVNVFWFYQTPACRGEAPNPRDLPRSNGATYVTGAPWSGGDMTLLRLSSVPSGVSFAGWTADPPAIGTKVAGIHHPSGDFRRISFGTLRAANTRDAGSFWGAYWDGGGLTEGGSSGSGLFLSDGRLIGTLSHGPKYDTAAEYCAALPFADNYGRLSTYYPILRQFLEGGGSTTPPPPPPTGGTGALTSGVPASFQIGPATGGRLYNGTSGFQINVPAGATRLEIRVATTTPNVDVDLYARFGQDVGLTNGTVVRDHASSGPAGDEVIVITASTTPALRAGTYYIALGLFTNNVAVQGTLTATVTTSAPPPSGNSQVLTSGNPQNFRLGPITNGGTLFRGNLSYTIAVPAGATELEIRVATSTPGADVDLYARAGQDVSLENGRVVSDYSSTSDGGNEVIRINVSTTPPLRAGVYYIALGLFTNNVTAEGTVTATVRGGADPPPTTGGNVALSSGVTRNLTIAPVSSPTLLSGALAYRIDVPAGAQRLDIQLRTPGRTDFDLDLYARYGQPVSLSSGRIQADHRSEGPAGEETLVITPSSALPLRAGTYYIHMAVFTTGETINATLTATVSLRDTPPPPPVTGNVLNSGEARSYNLPAVTAPRLFTGENGFRVDVPEGATRLDIRLSTPNPAVDVDLYVRGGSEPALVNSRVTADASGTGPDGNEFVSISGAALRPGTYYIALALFTANLDANGTITATVTTAEPTDSATLRSGVPSRFRIGPVTTATLFAGTRGFQVNVPEGATRLELRLTTETPDTDVDLYARAERDVSIENGRVSAEYLSESLTGNEVIVITPNSTPALRAGTYFIALGLFTNNVEATGTITATITAAAAPPTNTGGSLLTPGVASKFTFGPVSTPTLFNGANSFRVVVPEGAARLEIRLLSETPSVDTDLYVRREADVDLADGQVVADFEGSSTRANETIVVTGDSLQPGTYYVSVAVFTRDAVARGSIVADIVRGGVSAPVKKQHADEVAPKRNWGKKLNEVCSE